MRIKSYVFRNMTPCSPFNINRQFGGTYRLHLQSRRIKINQREAVIKQKVTNCTLETLEEWPKQVQRWPPFTPRKMRGPQGHNIAVRIKLIRKRDLIVFGTAPRAPGETSAVSYKCKGEKGTELACDFRLRYCQISVSRNI
jgi:hypothetical protein